MSSYFDTSVLLPAYVPSHELHRHAQVLLRRVQESEDVGYTTLHTYGELYSSISRASQYMATLSLEHLQTALQSTLGSIIQLVELSDGDYRDALSRCTTLNLRGPVFYDALHFQAAVKCGATILYTDNTKDFNRLLTEADTVEVRGIR